MSTCEEPGTQLFYDVLFSLYCSRLRGGEAIVAIEIEDDSDDEGAEEESLRRALVQALKPSMIDLCSPAKPAKAVKIEAPEKPPRVKGESTGGLAKIEACEQLAKVKAEKTDGPVKIQTRGQLRKEIAGRVAEIKAEQLVEVKAEKTDGNVKIQTREHVRKEIAGRLGEIKAEQLVEESAGLADQGQADAIRILLHNIYIILIIRRITVNKN